MSPPTSPAWKKVDALLLTNAVPISNDALVIATGVRPVPHCRSVLAGPYWLVCLKETPHHANPRVFISAAVLALSTAALGPASAQEKMRLGLWENSVTMKSQKGHREAALAQAQQALANMPPAQRKQMEKMMAVQGMNIRSGPQDTSIQVCIAPEQAALNQNSAAKRLHAKNHARRRQHHAGGFQLQGRGEPSADQRRGHGPLQGPTAYNGNFKIKTHENGKSEQIDMAQQGCWLSNDCGSIQPVQLAR